MENEEPKDSLELLQKRIFEFCGRNKRDSTIVATIFSFFFLGVPGAYNAYTGKPFGQWLQEQGINMSTIDFIFWGIGISIFVILLINDKKSAQKSQKKFSRLPWIYAAALMVFCFWLQAKIRINTITSPNDLWKQEQETFAGQIFKNQTIDIDGKKFIDCTFDNVTWIYNGTGRFDIADCKFMGNFIFDCPNKAALNYAEFMTDYPKFGLMYFPLMNTNNGLYDVKNFITFTNTNQ